MTPPYPRDVPLKAGVGRWTHGMSPAALAAAWQDWAVHLVTSPGKQLALLASAQRAWLAHAQALAEMAGSMR